MALAFDAVISEAPADGTIGITVGGGADRVLYVLFDCDTVPTSVTRDGQSFTKIADSGLWGNTLWRLIAPNTGTADIVATGWTGSMYYCAAIAFEGADQTTPERAAVQDQLDTTSPANPDVLAVTSEVGDLVVSVCQQGVTGGSTLTPDGTQRDSRVYGSSDYREVWATKPGAASSTNMSYTSGGSPYSFYHLGWAIRPAASGPTYTQSLSASLTATATAGRKTSRSVTASVTATTVAVRKAKRTVSASVTGAGVAVRKTKRTVSASVTGTTVLARKVKRTVSASVTATAALGRKVGRSLAASVTATTTLGRHIARSLAASLTPAGGLTPSALYQQAVSASLTATATVGRGIRATLAASVQASTALARQVRLTVAASLTATAAVARDLITDLGPGYIRATLTFVAQTVSSLTHRAEVAATLTDTAESTAALTNVAEVNATLTHHTDD